MSDPAAHDIVRGRCSRWMRSMRSRRGRRRARSASHDVRRVHARSRGAARIGGVDRRVAPAAAHAGGAAQAAMRARSARARDRGSRGRDSDSRNRASHICRAPERGSASPPCALARGRGARPCDRRARVRCRSSLDHPAYSPSRAPSCATARARSSGASRIRRRFSMGSPAPACA